MVEPIKLTLGDGSIIIGQTLEDAFENVKKAKEHQTQTPPVPQPRRIRSRKFDEDANRVRS